MPRHVPHFKVLLSIQNHVKAMGVYEDDTLLAMFTRIGMMAVERYADRTEDSFLCCGLDLERLAGCRGVANARRKLGRLEASSRLTVCQEGAGYRLTIPNFAKKQGFGTRNRAEIGPPSSTTSSTTSTASTKKKARAPSAAPVAVKSLATLAPLRLEPEQYLALQSWAEGKGLPSTTEAMEYAWETVYDWSQAGPNLRANWAATARNAIKKGWALKGFQNGNGSTVPMTFEQIDAADKLERFKKLTGGKNVNQLFASRIAPASVSSGSGGRDSRSVPRLPEPNRPGSDRSSRGD
jgi:hypothetical protein